MFFYFIFNRLLYSGRLDSTNVVDPLLSVICSIGLDHCDLLGSTIDEICAEKSGIIKPNRPVIVGPQVPHYITRKYAKERGCDHYIVRNCNPSTLEQPILEESEFFHFDDTNNAISETAMRVFFRYYVSPNNQSLADDLKTNISKTYSLNNSGWNSLVSDDVGNRVLVSECDFYSSKPPPFLKSMKLLVRQTESSVVDVIPTSSIASLPQSLLTVRVEPSRVSSNFASLRESSIEAGRHFRPLCRFQVLSCQKRDSSLPISSLMKQVHMGEYMSAFVSQVAHHSLMNRLPACESS